jgi:hypothetical protein
MAKNRAQVMRIYKATFIVAVAIALVVLIIITNFMGLTTYASLSIIAGYVGSTNETLEISDRIRLECGEEDWNCYIYGVAEATPRNHIWEPTPPRWIQSPETTLENGEGNCVDKSVLQATLLKELDMEHVHLVAQPHHICVMVSHPKGIQALGCYPDDPMLGILEV